MNNLAELVLSLCSLFEAEGRLLRENILLTLSRFLLIVAGAGFAVTALAFFLAGIYNILLAIMPKALALACLGLASALISFIFFWSSALWRRKKKQNLQKEAQE